MGAFFRVAAALLLCVTLAHGGETPNQPEEKILAVSVSAADDNKIAEALDLRDVEHFIVSELKARRIAAVAFTSIQDSLESEEGVYVVEVGIDQAEIAQRPQWSRLESRFRDDEILHLELSLSATRLHDSQSLGDLNRSYDYRAEDSGRFSSPQAIRGAVYEAVAALSDQFATGVNHGDFGEDLDSFQHPLGLQDLIDLWNRLSLELKTCLVLIATIVLILIAALTYQLLCAVESLFAPR